MFVNLAKKVLGENCKITFHSLRHSFASNLAIQEVPIFTISKLLGHANIATTQIYTHLAPDNLHDVVNCLNIG